MLLTAPLIFPVDRPPILDAALVVRGGRIVAVGKRKDLLRDFSRHQTVNLEGHVLLPGFVNAHAHLELTALRGFAYPGSFTAWVEKLMGLKSALPEAEIVRGIREGVNEMLKTGTTTVGDHAGVSTPLAPLLQSPLKGRVFLEVLSLRKETARETLRAARALEKSHRTNRRWRVSASPHSVHALHPDVLEKTLRSGADVFSVHLAESEEERLYFKAGEGALSEFIRRRGAAPPAYAKKKSAVLYLETQHLWSGRVLVVHGNGLTPRELGLLARHRNSLVYCPASHAYFGHRPPPVGKILAKGVNLALGTDSLASGPSLAMGDQIRLARAAYPKSRLKPG